MSAPSDDELLLVIAKGLKEALKPWPTDPLHEEQVRLLREFIEKKLAEPDLPDWARRDSLASIPPPKENPRGLTDEQIIADLGRNVANLLLAAGYQTEDLVLDGALHAAFVRLLNEGDLNNFLNELF